MRGAGDWGRGVCTVVPLSLRCKHVHVVLHELLTSLATLVIVVELLALLVVRKVNLNIEGGLDVVHVKHVYYFQPESHLNTEDIKTKTCKTFQIQTYRCSAYFLQGLYKPLQACRTQPTLYTPTTLPTLTKYKPPRRIPRTPSTLPTLTRPVLPRHLPRMNSIAVCADSVSAYVHSAEPSV